MSSIALYSELDLKSVLAVTQAREIALRTNGGLVDGEHILFGISVVGLRGAVPITDSLMVAAGLTKTAILSAIGPEDDISSEAHGRFAPSVERIWETAKDMAARYDSADVKLAYVLYAVIDQARIDPESGVAKLISQLSPHLNLDQMIEAIDDLLGATDRAERVKAIDEDIAKDTAEVKLVKGKRHANIHQGGSQELTLKLDRQIAAAELALRVTKTVRATHMFLSARS